MYPLELKAASGADELDAVDVAILEEDDLCSPVFVLQYLEEDDLCFRNPSTPALILESKYSSIQNSCAISADSIHYIVCTMDLYYSRRQCAVRPQLLQCTVSARPLAIMPHQRSHYAPPEEPLCPTRSFCPPARDLFVHQTKKYRNCSALKR